MRELVNFDGKWNMIYKVIYRGKKEGNDKRNLF